MDGKAVVAQILRDEGVEHRLGFPDNALDLPQRPRHIHIAGGAALSARQRAQPPEHHLLMAAATLSILPCVAMFLAA